MTDLTKLDAQLSLEEGNRLTVYDDATGLAIVKGYTVKGNPTIGIGRLLTSAHGLTQAEVNYLLNDDIAVVTPGVAAMLGPVWSSLVEPRQRVLIDMGFNLGLGGLAGFPHMIAAIKAGDWKTASAEMLDSAAARQLPTRYAALAKTMLTGVG